jgi:hypothetical protein
MPDNRSIFFFFFFFFFFGHSVGPAVATARTIRWNNETGMLACLDALGSQDAANAVRFSVVWLLLWKEDYLIRFTVVPCAEPKLFANRFKLEAFSSLCHS